MEQVGVFNGYVCVVDPKSRKEGYGKELLFESYSQDFGLYLVMYDEKDGERLCRPELMELAQVLEPGYYKAKLVLEIVRDKMPDGFTPTWETAGHWNQK